MTDAFEGKELDLVQNISVDCVVFGFDLNALELNVLLIERKKNPDYEYEDFFALPGNLIRQSETFDQSAIRVLKELTSIQDIFLEQLMAFGNPNRTYLKENDRKWLQTIRPQPDERVVTIAYYSLINLEKYKPTASSFAKKAIWMPVKDVPELAFDHSQILNKAFEALKLKLRTEPVGFNLLPRKFTLGQLQSVYETILGIELDKRNFRRKMLNKDILIQLDEKQKGVAHKSPYLYKFDQAKYEALRDQKFDFSL